MIISLVLISLFAVGAVSAADDVADDTVIAGADDEVDMVSVADDTEVVGADEDAEELSVDCDAEKDIIQKADSEDVVAFNISDYMNSSGGNGSNSSNGTFDFSQIMDIMSKMGGSNTTITAKDVTVTFTPKIKYTATIKSGNSTLTSGAVTFTIDNKDYAGSWSDGVVSVSLKNLKAGKHYIYIEYGQTSVKKTITVKKAKTQLSASKKTFKAAAKTKKYTVTLKASKNKVKKAKLTLKLNGKTYKATTNAKGKATFKITKLTKKGKFAAKVKFAGNSYYKAASKTVKSIIIK